MAYTIERSEKAHKGLVCSCGNDHYFTIKTYINNPRKNGMVDKLIQWECSNPICKKRYEHGKITEAKEQKNHEQTPQKGKKHRAIRP